MNKKMSLTNSECIFYLLYSFSVYSDNNFNQNECELLNQFMKSWDLENFDFENSLKKFNSFNEHNEINHANDIKEVMTSISEHLRDILDLHQKETLLMQIRFISYADKNFHESEKKWHDLISKILGLELKISSQNLEDLNQDFKFTKRKPMGFKSSWS